MSVEPERRGGLDGGEDKIHKTFDGRAKNIKPEKQPLRIEDSSDNNHNLIEDPPQEIPMP